MFCPDCGKELLEGEVCTCSQEKEQTTENAPTAEKAVNEAPQAQQAYYAPPVQNAAVFPGTYYDPAKAYENAQPTEKLPARSDYPEGYKIKRKYVAVLLAASVGMFGIHNFYLGNKDKALAQLLIAIVGGIFTLGIGFLGATVWAMVECILLLTDDIDRDSNGYKIQTFEEAIAKEMKKGE